MEFKKLNPIYLINRFNEWLDKKNMILQIIILLSIAFVLRTYIFGLYWVPTGSMEPTILVGEGFLGDKITLFWRPVTRGEIISFNDPHYVYSDNFFVKLFEKYIFGPDSWTKRVIGIPGDHVVGKIIDGKTHIYLNGQELEEPYINPFPIVQVRENAWQLCFKFPGVGNTPLLSIPFMQKVSSRKYRVFDPQFTIDSKEQPFYNLYLEDKLPSNEYPMILYPRTPYPNQIVSDVFDVVLKEDEYWCMGDNRLGSYDSRGFGRVFKDQIHGRIAYRIFSLKSPNSLIFDCILMPFYKVYQHFAELSRSWNRWFMKVK